MDECFRFVCQFRPVQVLATLPLCELLNCQLLEIKALIRYVDFDMSVVDVTNKEFLTRLNFFCERVVDQKFIVERPDHDYRLFLFNVLHYKESPTYLLNLSVDDVEKCTKRQLQMLLRYLLRYTEKSPDWPLEYKQLFYNTIACGSLFPLVNIVNQIKKLFSSKYFKLKALPNFKKKLFLLNHDLQHFVCNNVNEIIDMFEHYDYVSSERNEAKIIATGFGLDPAIHWPYASDYIKFCRNCQRKRFFFSKPASLELTAPTPVNGSCIFCCTNDADTVRTPCGHVFSCYSCESLYDSPRCGLCRQTGNYYKMYKNVD